MKYLIIEIYACAVHWLGTSRARRFRNSTGLKLNFGCGPALKSGFLNVDFSSHADLRMDLRRKIPLPDNSCELLFTEHFVEHLSYPEGAEQFFEECQRILEPGGKLLVSVPDSEWSLREYGSDSMSYLKACEEHQWHPEECETLLEHINYHFRQRARGRSPSGFGVHRFAYDFETMAKVMRATGFESVERRDFDSTLDSEHRRVGSLRVGGTNRAE